MSGELKIVMTGEEGKLWESLQRIIAQSTKIEEGAKRNEVASTNAEVAAQKLAKTQADSARQGSRLVDELLRKNETLNQKYDRQKAAIEEAGRQGVKTPQEVATALEQLQDAHEKESAAAIKAEEEKRRVALEATDAYKEQQKQINEGKSAADKLLESTKSLDEKHLELQKKIKAAFDAGKLSVEDYNKALQQASEEVDNAAGDEQGDKVISFGKKFLTAAAAIKVVSNALQQVKKDREEALSVDSSLEDSRRKLRGMIGHDFAELETQADDMALLTGLDRKASRDFVFKGTSAGVKAHDQLLAARVAPYVDPEDALKYMIEMKKEFEKLGGEEALNIGFKATELGKGDLGNVLKNIAEVSRDSNFSAQENAAYVAALSNRFGEDTGKRLAELFNQMKMDERFEGQSGINAQGLLGNMSDEEISQFADGNRQMIETIREIVNQSNAIRDMYIEISKSQFAGDGSLVRRQADSVDRRELARRRRNIGKAADEIVTEASSTDAIEEETHYLIQSAENRQARRDGEFLQTPIVGALDWLDWMQSAMFGAGKIREQKTGELSDEYRKKLLKDAIIVQPKAEVGGGAEERPEAKSEKSTFEIARERELLKRRQYVEQEAEKLAREKALLAPLGTTALDWMDRAQSSLFGTEKFQDQEPMDYRKLNEERRNRRELMNQGIDPERHEIELQQERLLRRLSELQEEQLKSTKEVERSSRETVKKLDNIPTVVGR